MINRKHTLLLKVRYTNEKHENAVNMLFTCKGPLPNTLEDFWRMIWEQKLPTIVMLTKCFEDRVSLLFITVTCDQIISIQPVYFVNN